MPGRRSGAGVTPSLTRVSCTVDSVVWTVNRHLILSLNYTFIDVAGPAPARTRAFQALATLTL